MEITPDSSCPLRGQSMRSVLSGGLLGTYLTGPLLKITAEVPMIGGRMIKTNDATAVLSRCLLLSLIISAISTVLRAKSVTASSSSASLLRRKTRSLLDQLLCRRHFHAHRTSSSAKLWYYLQPSVVSPWLSLALCLHVRSGDRFFLSSSPPKWYTHKDRLLLHCPRLLTIISHIYMIEIVITLVRLE